MVKKSVNLLPAFFRTDRNSKFLSSTIDQFIKDPTLERLDGFVGSKLSKNYDPNTDQYITFDQPLRNRYQLEPGLIIKELDGSIAKAYGYDDLINQISYHGGNVSNLNKLFKPEFYSYDPKINWDKLINFREYYWLPTGPNPVKITGTQRELVSTYTVNDDSSNNFFVLTPDGLTPDPQITLYRGSTYVFNNNSTHKFYIRKNSGYGTHDLYDNDVVGNGTDQIIINVTYTTPDILYYASDTDQILGGQILIKTVDENSFINVDAEIIGKAQYKSGNGVEFINGLKVNFAGNVMPATYRNKDFIVEGVGNAITLIDFSLLETPEYSGANADPDFDETNFDDYPFDDFRNVPVEPSYITVNMASKDRNPWARYNRWFHADAILASSTDGTLPVENRARRPIIEFVPNLQLFNFGHTAVGNIDVIDNLTTDAFSVVESSLGYWADGVLLDEGFRVIFNADTDPLVRGKIYVVRTDTIDGVKRINLEEAEDATPFYGSCVSVLKGDTNAGTSWWNNGTTWVKGQQRTTQNQAPLFDIFDSNGYSYGGEPYSSDFAGTRVFGYADGTVYDSVLGLNLKYKTTGLESSYVFANFFMTDEIISNVSTIDLVGNVGFLKLNADPSNPSYVNVWTEAAEYNVPVVQFQVAYDAVSSIEITTFDNPALISDLSVVAFVNDVKTTATISTDGYKAFVNFETTIPASSSGTRIRLDIYTSESPNSTGVYDTPINLTNNPLNGPVSELLLSEMYDHVQTMVDRDPNFTGSFPGSSNLGNLPNVSKYGTRIVSNKNPLAFAQYFISNKSNNLIEAIKSASNDYNQFKLNLIKTVAEIDNEGTIVELVDNALAKINENKNITFPYFTSDMVPYGTNKKTRSYTVTDKRNLQYSITSIFDNNSLSNTAILVYLNGEQLIVDKDYVFEKYDTTITFVKSLQRGDQIVIEEYLNTNGCFCPPTPTKLGLYPKFVPEIYLDETYSDEPRNVIQCHDGSLLLAFNDYRDDAILEFEKRVYNNIKSTYDSNLLDLNTILPGAFRNNDYSYSDLHSFISSLFLKWTGFFGIDFETNNTYDVDNHKTYNYSQAADSITGSTLPGSWRAIFKYYFDTDRPNTHPWEMLGITVKPSWWDDYYGPAPYTAGNSKLWDDLEAGRIAQGDNAGVNLTYARPGLSEIIPVDDSGNLIDLRVWATIGQNDSIQGTDDNWSFGQWGPAENAWRRSSYWPFAAQIMAALAKPASYAALFFDTSRLKLNAAGQYTYTGNKFLSPSILNLSTDVVNSETVRASGYSVYVIEAGKKKSADYVATLKEELTNGDFNLFTKLGGFVNKDKLSIIVDAVQLGTQNPTPYLPDGDYSIYFNTSNPVKTVAISGIIVIKSTGKFIIRGYDNTDLFFKIYQPIHQYSDTAITVGSRSEEFVSWSSGQMYLEGQIVYHNNVYYRVISDHKASTAFETKYYNALSSLPIVGGTRVAKTNKFETEETIIPYGKEMETIQEVYDFLAGYGKWLEAQGFVFDEYSDDFQQVIDWDFTAKEFIYWTDQNWAVNSVITLSPFANRIKFTFQEGVVDNIFDSFYEYSLLRADGIAFPAKNFSLIRNGNEFLVQTKNTSEGIFFAKLHLVQKEHTLVFNNTTIFSDVLYDTDTGYRQLRLKLKGFRTAEWNGDAVSPGFVYDDANINLWTPYQDYQPGDIAEYVGKYYSAKKKIIGTETFDFSKWFALSEKPIAQLLPNFEYKIDQFEDFYSLDIDNFDLAQQKMAQHLIGYSPRPYLENIFDNPISQYKFYQGFVKEKGTRNALTKLEKASVANLQGKLEFNEEWAFRIGYFGGFTNYKEIEFPLRENEFIENTQELSFVSELPLERNNATSYIEPSDLVISYPDYASTQTFTVVDGTYLNNNLLLPHAGYVRIDDVTFTTTSTSALFSNSNVRSYNDGDTFWVGFEPAGEWNVYRYTKQAVYLTSVSIPTQFNLLFTTNKNHGFAVGDVISVARMEPTVDGVYKITSIPTLDTFTVGTTLAYIPPSEVEGTLYKFNKMRFSNVDDISELSYVDDIKEGDLFWVDDNGEGKWTVYRKLDNYDSSEYIAPRSMPGQQYGYALAKQETSSTIIVSAPLFNEPTAGGRGRIYAYTFNNGSFTPLTNYSLNSSVDEYRPTADLAGFGDNLFYDETDDLIFASASNASNVKTDASGTVKQARGTNVGSTLTNVGLVKISGLYRKRYPLEVPYAVLACPETNQNTRFGSSLHVARTKTDKKVIIGAPGQSSNQGKAYVFDLNIVKTVDRVIQGVTGTNTYGFGASFDVTVTDRTYNINIVNTGSGYTTSSFSASKILIPGASLGGLTPDNNLIVTIGSTGTNGTVLNATATGVASIATFSIVAQPAQHSLSAPVADGWATEYGVGVTGNSDATRIAVSAPGASTGSVYVYVYDVNSYTLVQSIKSTDSPIAEKINVGGRLGETLVMSEDGNYLFIGSTKASDNVKQPGKVWIYTWNGSQYEFLQRLDNPASVDSMKFATNISINTNNDILAITSQGQNSFMDITFDNGKTTFDGESCLFGEVDRDSGTAYIYNRYNTKFILSQELYDSTVDSGSYYGDGIVVNENTVFVGSPGSLKNGTANGSVYIWDEIDPDKNSWEQFRVQEPTVDTSLIRQVTTLDSLTEKVFDYLDVIDPIKGQIAGIADQEIRYKTPFDPAVYSNGSSTVVVDSDSYWTNPQVGQLWWDLSAVKYMWYEQSDRQYRKNTWGNIFPGSSIDVYEWIETRYTPSQWASLADTNEGLTEGISGQPKFADDTVYSTREYFDKTINQFTTLYYFWVKNRTIVPADVENRRISAKEVASIIEDPKGYGLRYISIIDSDALSVVNFKSSLIGNRIYMNIAANNIDSDIKNHTEWALVQENSAYSSLPALIEKKMIDSLLGKDSVGNLVPDPSLPARQRYGIEIRPKQGMFVNRANALRNVIEFTNSVLKDKLTRGYIGFTNLNSKEEIPDITSREYDQVVETIEGRDIIVTVNFETATASCKVENGRIIEANIINPGSGYLVPPTITVLNDTTNAKIETEIDENGSVTGLIIKNPGYGFVNAPTLVIRPYTVIVQVDPDFNTKWSKFEWNGSSWDRMHTQRYDTTKYWNYIDWVDSSFNVFKPLSNTIEELYELAALTVSAGDYVKVKNPGDNKYIILRKTEEGVIGNFDADFDIIYSESGTIQILDSVWNVQSASIGFDTNSTFDQLLYDESAEIELQKIISAIKDDIFVGSLKVYWNKFFFKCVKYALTEQRFLDWAFKTSFINVRNIAGVLDQRTTYRFQDPTWYEDYLKEVKPYKTQIRNYQVNYQIGNSQDTPYELSSTFSTDFDLPVVYDRSINAFTPVDEADALIDQYPYKSWNDNKSHHIESITLVNGGSGYRVTPEIKIIPAAGDTGSGATAIAYIAYGKITEIELVTAGDGYTKTPTVLILGGGDVNLTPAIAYANLANKKVRSNLIGMKFDRTSPTREILDSTFTDTFVSEGTDYEYPLTWYASTDKSTIEVFLSGIIVSEVDYNIVNYVKVFNGYHKKYSKLVLNEVPTKSKIIKISYTKNIEIYSAADRVSEYYNPLPGMPGNQLEQVMEGIAFPGVVVKGLPLSYSSFWDSTAFGESAWDDDGTGFNDLDTVISGGDFTTSTSGAFATARGLSVSDIILDGDGFVTPNTSHAPEEMVPGQVMESVSISVFTREEKGAPLVVRQSALIDSTVTNTVVNLTLQPANTSSVMVSFNDRALVYSKDYVVNFAGKTLTINTQTVTGSVGITTIGVGGSELIAARTITTTDSSVTIKNIGLYSEIGSIYVTVNGETLSSTSTGLGYTLSTVSSTNLGAKLVVHGMSTSTNIVQVWAFRAEYKAYSEVKEQIVTVSSTATTFDLIQPPGVLGPFHAQVVVELDGLRLTPPDTTYYSVDSSQLVYDIRPDEVSAPGIFNLSQLEVHVNGIKQKNGIDFVLDQINNRIVFNPGFLADGDVLAITILLGADYVITNNQLVLANSATPGKILKVITYTNHDASNIRTEVFTANSSRLYRMEREVLNDSYVWVSIGGRPLICGEDFSIQPDNKTVEISIEYNYTNGEKVIVTSLSDAAVSKTIGYRIFKDMLGRTHYKRFSEQNTTFLTQDLAATDDVIYVDNASVLADPVVEQNQPGVVFIAGERIEYFVKAGNTLTQLRRTTLGTAANSDAVYTVGTAVVDQSRMQNIPTEDAVIKQIITATTATVYALTDIVLDPAVSAHDQIEVHYGGRVLQKPTASGVVRYSHDISLAYDSNEHDSDIVLDPDFTISGTNIVLSFDPIPGTRIIVLKNTDRVWYNSGSGAATNGDSLLSATTAQAKFLLERQSGLPDKYQYVQN